MRGTLMGLGDDIDVLAKAVAELEPQERGQRWTHLSLCVIDAVFSIGARYSTTTRTAHDYARAVKLRDPLLPPGRASSVIGTAHEEPLTRLVSRVDAHGVERWAVAELANRQRTSTRSGVLKAQAARDYAEILVNADVKTLDDVALVLNDATRLTKIEAELARVPGHGKHGVRLGYLWMLAGDDHTVKPDRMVLRWIRRALDRDVSVDETRELIGKVAARLALTPWAVDHAVWNDERRRPPGARRKRG